MQLLAFRFSPWVEWDWESGCKPGDVASLWLRLIAVSLVLDWVFVLQERCQTIFFFLEYKSSAKVLIFFFYWRIDLRASDRVNLSSGIVPFPLVFGFPYRVLEFFLSMELMREVGPFRYVVFLLLPSKPTRNRVKMPSCYYLFKVYSQSAESRCIESGRLVLLSSEAREPAWPAFWLASLWQALP